MKADALLAIDRMKPRMIELSDRLHENPELSYQEYRARDWLTEELETKGFTVVRGIAGLKTAFKATFKREKEHPLVCFMVEYDALPDIGHACGHNVHGTASIAASIAVRHVMETHRVDGSVMALGTPGEELYSGKVAILKAGCFQGVDLAMMVHAYHRDVVQSALLALDALEFTFRGKPAHAAGSPHEGVNALNAARLTFAGIDALRQHVRDDVRIHGIIREGGNAVNVVPERASVRFMVRSKDRWYLNDVTEKVKNCARGAALMTGAELEISHFEPSVDNLISVRSLKQAYRENWERMFGGIEEEMARPTGSSDVGSVSHVVPTLYPRVSIAPQGILQHTREFAEAAGSEKAHDGLIRAAKALATTALDFLTSKELRERVWKDFKRALRARD
jgi:amidohydrolase